ncbi:MAG TPA: FAD-dependent oxidoreductase [Frankiaceae bacterium]|jgi:3-phenylpropionate/trans-cinnamate dioxygenase ferredoxin reductase subunit|nr:FAD-dependent oxidoreductase [Frankiaceae bacterium]
MASNSTLLIIGGGLAGAKAAAGAREAGFEGRIVIVGEESHDPYERPPLSKEILRAEKASDSSRVNDSGHYAEHSVELITGDAVTSLDAGAKRAQLASGTSISFDAAVLATGAAPRKLTLPGADLAGVHYLRTIEDSVALHDAITKASRVAVIGAGWIGSEVAASARQLGADVVLIEPLPAPLHRVLGTEVGSVFSQLHTDHGVAMRLGVGVAKLEGGSAVERVVLEDGRVEAADVVVAGVGVTPRIELAEAAGLTIDNGVVVDQNLQSNAPGIFAAGDIANAFHPHYQQHIRIEHWANALNQGAAAGANASGDPTPYTRLPYFFSDQYDLGLEYVGYASADDEVVIRGDAGKREFIAFYHRGGIVTAAMNVNIWDVVDDLRAIITAGKRVDVAKMADPSVPLSELVS